MSRTYPCCNWHAAGGSFLMACNSGYASPSLRLPPPLAPSPTLRTYEQGVADGRAAAAAEARAEIDRGIAALRPFGGGDLLVGIQQIQSSLQFEIDEHRRHHEAEELLTAERDRLLGVLTDVEQAARDFGSSLDDGTWDSWHPDAQRDFRERAADFLGRMRARAICAVSKAAEVCEWYQCKAVSTTRRTDIGGTTFALCRPHAEEGDRRRYHRPVAPQDSEAAEVNHDRRDDGAQAQPAGAAAASTGQAGGEQSSPAGPPAGPWEGAWRGMSPPWMAGKDAGPLVSSMPIRQWPARLVPGPITVVNESTAPGIDFLSFSVLPVQGAGKELLRVPAGVTPAELREAGFPDVAARLEGGSRG